VLVTGGGRGLGRSIALGLAEAGADLFVASRKQANCESVAAEIRALGRHAVAVEADLGSPDSIEALADRVLGEAGRLHVLVNNAAIVWAAPTLEYPMTGWDKVFNVNVRGLWQLSQRVARHMAERGGGSIVHVSSNNAYQGDFEERQNIIAYNASKGAVRSLTKDMAVKLAPHGIRVNAISPGAFHTAMIDPIEAQPKLHAALVGRIPMGRIGDADEIKGAAVFLASDAASYVTGATLVVDGGMLSL
jgi:gluconate 5-dehydrogenase